MGAPTLRGVYETVLYVADLARAARFYAEELGLTPVPGLGGAGGAFRLADGGMLLLFDPDQSAAPGRVVPSHGAHGPGHVAFAVAPGELDGWVERLKRRSIEVEREIAWPVGGRSIYVRDPAGNSVELIEGEAWA
jgi:catechol 2,3-dioxygenase-like lactoylglutathione lyase family enzyme